MNYSELRVDLEQKFTKIIKESLRVDLINSLIRSAQVEQKNSLSKRFEGVYFPVTKDFCEDIWNICQEAIKRTGYTEKIDFYIINSNDYNAFCLESNDKDQPHIIGLHSSIVKDFTHDELLFIVGHEIGHLWTGNRSLLDAISFIFNDNKGVPFFYQNRIMYWNRLSELSADRFGLLACGELETAVSCFFKLTSGLDWRDLGINIKSYIENNDQVLENVKGEQAFDHSTHPINPIRVKALQMFAASVLFSSACENQELQQDKDLENALEDLMEDHTALAEGLNLDQMIFMATGGLIISGCDQQINPDEYNKIVSQISRYTLYPKKMLNQIVEEGKVDKLFAKSVENILKKNPAARDSMLAFLFEMVIADNDINEKEIETLKGIGINMMGYSEKEISQYIAGGIYSVYIPRIR